MDPQVAATLQKNLQLIDQAMVRAARRLRAEPATGQQTDLFEAFHTKFLPARHITLVNKMRKRNQAEQPNAKVSAIAVGTFFFFLVITWLSYVLLNSPSTVAADP